MNKQYQRIRHSYEKEAIHHFRVEYKKLRAFLRLLSAGKDQGKIKIPGTLYEVYHKAGIVRDLQLHITTIGKSTSSSPIPVDYIGRLKKKLAAAKKELAKSMQPDVLPDSRKKIGKKINDPLADAIIENFVSAKMTEVSRIIARRSVRDTDLHLVRKKLKDVIYIALMFRKELLQPFPVKGWNAGKEKYLTDTATELGRFQDSCIALSHLKNDQQAVTQPADRDIIAGIYRTQSRLKRQQKQLLKKNALTLITAVSDRHH